MLFNTSYIVHCVFFWNNSTFVLSVHKIFPSRVCGRCCSADFRNTAMCFFWRATAPPVLFCHEHPASSMTYDCLFRLKNRDVWQDLLARQLFIVPLSFSHWEFSIVPLESSQLVPNCRKSSHSLNGDILVLTIVCFPFQSY